MKTKLKSIKLLVALLLSTAFLTSCVDEPPPTKTLMQGNWELTAATDTAGNDIMNKVAFPVTVMQLTDDNGMLGTIGPKFMYLVYGGGKWTTLSAKMGQVFDYANLRFNTGEYFVESGTVERFTVEGKLQATAIAGGVLSDLLQILNIGNGWLQQTVYHKFIGVKVSFPQDETGKGTRGENDVYDTMIWEFDDETQAVYNYKDGQGNYVLWQGWPVDGFTRGTFTWTKRTESVNEVVQENL
ncbi:MAG: hypothetical protein V4667_11730 [Bacteroidota bacterium]